MIVGVPEASSASPSSRAPYAAALRHVAGFKTGGHLFDCASEIHTKVSPPAAAQRLQRLEHLHDVLGLDAGEQVVDELV